MWMVDGGWCWCCGDGAGDDENKRNGWINQNDAPLAL